MKASLGWLVRVSVVLFTAACNQAQEQVTEPTTNINETTYKQDFSNKFNESCYQGFTKNLQQRTPPAGHADYQVAQGICECISYNLVVNNNVTQLEALSAQSPDKVLELTRPLVQSCSEQVQQKVNASQINASNAVSTATTDD